MQTASENSSAVLRRLDWAELYPQIQTNVRLAINHVSALSRISGRDLEKQLLLYLPRLPVSALMNTEVIRSEAERLALRICSLRKDYGLWLDRPQTKGLLKAAFVFRETEGDIARLIHENFHYLGSYHPGVHLGLYEAGSEELPVALASLAPMDIRRLEALFTFHERKQVLVLSRVFAFDWAPRNIISYLLSGVYRWIAVKLPEVRTLLSFVNPNLGFIGSSLLASNWRPFLEMEPACHYFGNEYVSYRVLIGLSEASRKRVERCSFNLRPLKLFRYDLI